MVIVTSVVCHFLFNVVVDKKWKKVDLEIECFILFGRPYRMWVSLQGGSCVNGHQQTSSCSIRHALQRLSNDSILPFALTSALTLVIGNLQLLRLINCLVPSTWTIAEVH